MKQKIVVTFPFYFSTSQKKRLEKLGDVTYYDTLPGSPEEWMKRTEEATIICSGKSGLVEKIYERKNVFYSLPFVAVGWIDKKQLEESGNTVSYAPGCNSYAVSEWIVAMTFLLFRKFNRLVNTNNIIDKTGSPDYLGLAYKKACILGEGNIGKKVGKVYEALGMSVDFFRREDCLLEKTKDCNVVVNVLSGNQTTYGLLNKDYFNSFNGKTFFITVTSSKIYDSEAMISALDQNKLLGVADDCGSVRPAGNYEDPYYKKLVAHPKILATPHISYQSDVTTKISNDMVIDNIEAWLKGKPINVFK